MTSERLIRHQKILAHLAAKDRKRSLVAPSGIDFTSNDYLAFAQSPRIRQAILTAIENNVAIGSGGSRLLRGHHPLFEALESEAAAFFGSEKSLYVGCGYMANLAIFSTLPQRGDIILYDERVHASILDGIAAGRAESMAMRHNDVGHIETTIQQWRKKGGCGQPWIAVESIYSMDGDRAPLSDLFKLVQCHDGFLFIDEAHATGVFGINGRGLANFADGQEQVLQLHTCGKALGVSGAIVCLNQTFYDYLINRARPFIYSTAPSPLIATSVREALKMLVDEPQHGDRLKELYSFANKTANLFGFATTGTQIIPIVLGKNSMAVHIAKHMQTAGFDIRSIRPPSIPEGTARLRIAITLHVSEKEVTRMFSELACQLEEFSRC